MQDIQYEIGLLKKLSPNGLERMERAYRRYWLGQRVNNLLKSSPGFNLLIVSIALMASTFGYAFWFDGLKGMTQLVALLWACYLFTFPGLMIVRLIKRATLRLDL